MQQVPLVSIITINYNGTSVTAELLQSLNNISYPNTEVIVVDNASEQPPHNLQQDFPTVNFIFSPENLGFAGGNNLGIRSSKGDIILLLNNDTEVATDFLEPIVNTFQEHSEIGCVSAKLIFHDRGKVIQYAGHPGLHWLTGRGFSRGFGEVDNGQYNDLWFCQLGHGAAMAFRRTMLETIGLMYEDYFLYYEEVDYCERIKQQDWQIAYVGSSTVYHKESMSVGKSSPLKLYYLTRNRLLFIRRNLHGVKGTLALMFYLLVSYPKGLLIQLINGSKAHRVAYINALRWHIKHSSVHKQHTL